MKKHSSSLGSLGIALSILLTKALEYYIELTYIEPLTPFSKHQVKDDVFGTTVEEEGADSDDEVQEKQPQELYKKAWGQATPFVGPYNEEARQHVLKEVASIMKRQAQYIREGFEIELVDENPFVWNVRLFNFPEDSDLANDLEQYHQRYELGEKDIVVEIKFTGAFPSEPPAVRVVKPRLQYLTGQVTFDGFLCVDFLLPQKWNRHAHMDTIIQQIKNSLIENKARVDLRTHFEYDTKQASEAYVRQQQFRSFRVPTANNFTQNMFVFSTEFSKSIVQSSKLQQIDRGNKVILSPAVAEKIFSSQEFQLPLIFEIKSLRGQRVYCGVSEFTAPDGNIIVPQFMMKDLFLTEGTKVQVRSVVLPMATRLKIQPHSKQFYEIQDHKSVLEKALFNFSCLTEGQTIPITDSNTNKTYLIEVVETLPDRAVSIMTDHGYLDVEIDFIPAVDLVDKNTLKERQDEERRIKRETRDQRIHKCIQHTLRKRVQKKQHVETALSRAKRKI
jgi:ubiquitin-protein ligase